MMFKKWLACLLVGLLLLNTPVAIAAPVTDSGVCGDGLTWTLDNEGTLTISGTGEMYDYNWGEGLPWGQDDLTKIINVVIENGVTNIGAGAFYDCINLKSVVIPDSVMYIGEAAFAFCTGLTEVTIPSNVEVVSSAAFMDCRQLKDITIQEGVCRIGNDAFRNCHSLTTVKIPSSVAELFVSTFSYCSNLTAIDVSEDNRVYCSEDGVLYDKHKISLMQYPSKKTGDYTIPDGVRYIEYESFLDCDGLTGITIPDSVIQIAPSAFAYCDGLTKVHIPGGVTDVGDLAFDRCSNLTDITIADEATGVDASAFADCAYYLEKSNWKDGVLYISNHLIKADTSISNTYSVRPGTKTIADSAFYRCKNLRGVIIPDGIVGIGSAAFRSCEGLTNVTIPDSVTYIGRSAFADCKKMTEISIPLSVADIGEYALGYYDDSISGFAKTSGFTIIGYSGTVAEKYADKNGFKFTSLGIYTALGDLDGQVGITAADALLVLQITTQKVTPVAAQANAADVDDQAGVTANDALLILQYATKKITAFPAA